MTDSAEAGSVVETPPAGTPAQPTDPAVNGSAAVSDTPFSGLSEGTRKWVETKGYKDVEALATAGMNAESKLGSAIHVPAADAPKEEWDKFHSRLPEGMRPVIAPDQLEFRRPEGLPEDVPYNDDLANAAKQWAVEAGASAQVAQAYHDKFVSFAAEQAKAQQAAIAKSVEETHDSLVKEWGPQDSEGFRTKLELADRAMKKLGLVDAYKAKGILLADGALTDPQIAKAFSAIGEAMFREDTVGAEGAVGEGNPFKRDANGNRNITAISNLVKSDPEKARRLAREAGENPDLWISSHPR